MHFQSVKKWSKNQKKEECLLTGEKKKYESIRGDFMEKIIFTFDDTNEEVEFFVLEQTKINGETYILVTDSEEDDAECLILKHTCAKDEDSIYEIVEDDTVLDAVSKVFEELLEDVDIV